MTNREPHGRLRDQLRDLAADGSPVPEAADVMAKAQFALAFADRWLAELVSEETAVMRGAADEVRQRYSSTGQNLDLTLEKGAEWRLTGSVDPVEPGWILIRVGVHRELIRLDEDGMFSAVIPADAGQIDIVAEFDRGLTMTVRDVDGQAP